MGILDNAFLNPAMLKAAAARRPRTVTGRKTAEAIWQAWLPHRPTSSWSLDQFLAPRQTLVVIAPYPGFEVVASDGLMAAHKKRGSEVRVVRAMSDAASTPANSTHESLQGKSVSISIGDHSTDLQRLSSTEYIARQQAAARDPSFETQIQLLLQRLIRRGDVVLSPWRLDGDAILELWARCAATVCSEKKCRFIEAPLRMWDWSHPGDIRVPWHRLIVFPLEPKIVEAKQEAFVAFGISGWLIQQPGDQPDEPLSSPDTRLARAHEYFLI
jgi:hypothetical protein